MNAGSLMVVQGGGPTPVFNTSLFGVIDEARRCGIARILGARNGVEGLIKGDLVDLTALPGGQLQHLKHTPGAALGSTRYKLLERDLERIVIHLRRLDVRQLLMIGGNGSIGGAELIGQAANRMGHELCVVAVPKTIDNDIPITDRCPGFASSARYAGQAVRDLGMDVRTLPQPVSIFETMGRSAGWLAAASVLGRIDDAHAPHLVYLPEKPFELDHFLRDIDQTVKRHGWAVAVVTEGIRTAAGAPVFEVSDASQRDALGRAIFGGVAAHLAGEVTRRLKIRCRWEQPGLCGRASMLHVAEQDRIDAEAVGRAGVRAAVQGHHLRMVALEPLGCAEKADRGSTTARQPLMMNGGRTVASIKPPAAACGFADATALPRMTPPPDASNSARAPRDPEINPCTILVPLSQVTGQCRQVPDQWLGESACQPVNDMFLNYVRPLVGELLDYAPPLKDTAPRLAMEKDVLR